MKILNINVNCKKGFLFLLFYTILLSFTLTLFKHNKETPIHVLESNKDQIILEGENQRISRIAVKEEARRGVEEKAAEKRRLEEAERVRKEEEKKKASVLSATVSIPSQIFGYSEKGRAITGSIFGSGSESIMLFGAIHGNEKGTATLLSTFTKEIANNPLLIGKDKKIIIIPILNPDGYFSNLNKVNANNVNLNLNFETTDWKQYGGDSNLFAGERPWTESESRTLREVVSKNDVKKIIAFHARGNLVNPEYGHVPSEELAKRYASISGYRYMNDSTWYYHGTATRWFVEKYKRPAITVELTEYTTSDWGKNKGALLELIK